VIAVFLFLVQTYLNLFLVQTYLPLVCKQTRPFVSYSDSSATSKQCSPSNTNCNFLQHTLD